MRLINGGYVCHVVGHRVAGPFQSATVRHIVYRRVRSFRLCRDLASACVLIAVVLPGAGCSTSVQISAPKEEETPLHTGSVPPTAVSTEAAVSSEKESRLPPEADLAFARQAASEALTRGGKDTSVPWENPHSGARGTITPLASAYRIEGTLCRDFLASYVAKEEEAWMQGEACRSGKDVWEIRRLRPWRKT